LNVKTIYLIAPSSADEFSSGLSTLAFWQFWTDFSGSTKTKESPPSSDDCSESKLVFICLSLTSNAAGEGKHSEWLVDFIFSMSLAEELSADSLTCLSDLILKNMRKLIRGNP
jgi:hypothetical protein